VWVRAGGVRLEVGIVSRCAHGDADRARSMNERVQQMQRLVQLAFQLVHLSSHANHSGSRHRLADALDYFSGA